MTLKCRAWSCDLCLPDRRKQLIALAHAGQPRTFITLTTRRTPGRSPHLEAVFMRRAWTALVRRIKKRWPATPLEYLAVFEATKAGWPHLHVVARAPYIPQAWLSDQWRDLTGSFVVWIEAIDQSRKVTSYVAKYVGKDPHRFAPCKRYWCTRGYDLTQNPREDEDDDISAPWEVVLKPLHDLEAELKARGWLTGIIRGELVARRPWVPP